MNMAVIAASRFGLGGWDTHANQGSSTGALANRLAALDAGLGHLRDGLGENWDQTVVAVVTEFGRTVHVNGTRGTDHGAVNGGDFIVDWPGLRKSDLYAGRDLLPTTDIRSLFKGVLVDHLEISPTFIDREIFPDSTTARPLQDLIKT